MDKKKVQDIGLLLDNATRKILIENFIQYCLDFMKIKDRPEINIVYDGNEAYTNKSYGFFDPENNTVSVVFANRSIADSFRTLAHELCHYKQNVDGKIKNPIEDGKTGTDIENEANSVSGVIMRNFGRKYPIIFTLKAE